MSDIERDELRLIVDTMSAAVWRCSRDLHYQWASRAYASWLGLSREDIEGRAIADVVGDDAFAVVQPYIRRVLDGERVEFEQLIPYLTIGPRWIHAVYVPVYDSGSTPSGWVSVVHDVTTQHDAQLALRGMELASRRLAAIVESSDDAIVSKNLDGIVTSWNVAAERMFGYTSEEMIGRSIRTIIPADRQTEEDEVLARIREGVRVDHFETIRQRKDGTLIPISLTVSPIHDNTGRIVGASKIARDISEHRATIDRTTFLAEAGRALGSSLNYESTLKTLASLAVPLIADWCVADIVGEDGLRRVAVAHRDGGAAVFDSPYSVDAVVRAGRSVFVGEITDDVLLQTAGGNTDRLERLRSLHLRSYVCAPLVAGGRPLGAMTFATESGRQFAERDVLFMEDVAARAALAVDNARAYDEARRASRLKDEFLATLSHELRTPLNAILGYVRMLQSGLITHDKQVKAIDTVARNATSLTHIIEDVLDVSRIISGKLRLDVQPVDISRVVADAVESVRPAASAKGVRLTVVADPRTGPVAGDPERLQQLIWNLVSNAVKFTPRDGQVQVRVERANSRIHIVVSDTGVGIAPEFLPHVFERFRQADAGTTRKHGGLGLGLAITRHLVELHGGTIEAVSDGPGKGTTLRVSLPVMIVHGAAASPGALGSLEAGQTTMPVPNLRGTRILVVDDDSDALMLVREILETTGADVTTVDSAKAALAYVETARPDVLIADLGMPEMDGFEFIAQLRHARNVAVRDVPAAALTAYARSEDRAKALRTGFQMHLAKPIDPGELMAAVASLAKRGRGN